MTNMKENNIPKHWQIKKLGEVCKLKNGYAFKSGNYESKGVPVIRISDINGGFVSSKNAVRVIPKDDYEDYHVEENDILVAMSGATTGKFGIYKSSEKAYQNQRVGKFKILDERILNNNFLFHQINSLKRQIEKDAYGGAQPNISSSKIEQMQIVVPPLSEQQAIVAKIEELFSELENGKQQLLTAQQQLKVYRQSLLKWAFEGKLTNKNVKEGEMLEGWKIEKFNDFCKLQRGYDLPLMKIQKGQYPVVTSSGINGYHNEYKANGPCLITGRSGGVGNIHFVDILKYWPHNTVLFVKDFCGNVPKFVYYFFIQFNFKKFSASTTIPTLDRKQLFNELINVPTIYEQQLIVSELESKLTLCDKIQETISESLQQAETLKQSILKKAFEGKLI